MRTLKDTTNTDRPERRTALVSRELARYNLDIVALSETRRPGEGHLREELGGYTFFWKGLPEEERRIHHVGFAIKNRLLPKLTELPLGINERLMTLRLQLTSQQHAFIISAYASTLDASDETKVTFYQRLEDILAAVPAYDKIILLGDFNARVGRDYQLWDGVISRNRVRKCNDNGTLLLIKCTEHRLVITNTVFSRERVSRSLGNIPAPSTGTWWTTSSSESWIKKMSSRPRRSPVQTTVGQIIGSSAPNSD